MSNFCKQCSEHFFGKDYGDLAEMGPKEMLMDRYCEGCAETIQVNFDGERADGKWLNPNSEEYERRMKLRTQIALREEMADPYVRKKME